MRRGLLVVVVVAAAAAAASLHQPRPPVPPDQNRPLGAAHASDPPDNHKHHRFLNHQTKKYALNGTAIPDVDFDIGEAYAGLMSISKDPDGPDKFFFWFQPSTNPAADREILIWLNGGPGCSSLEGLLQENGPFAWQYGTFRPVANPWAWHRLTHVLWVEQPLGTGFSTGNVTARGEEDLARQFMGFFANFVDAFGLHGYKVYITGESYAGMYCPYIADAMLAAKDATYFNVKGMLLYDPAIIDARVTEMTVAPFVEHNRNLFPLNDSFVAYMRDADRRCGYAAARDTYLAFPPAGPLPATLPGLDPATGLPLPGCGDYELWSDVRDAATQANPCFDVYQVATTCPLLWDVLGFPGTFGYLPKGASVYFNRPDVKKAIHAPVAKDWATCAPAPVFVNSSDQADWSSLGPLPRVIDRTGNVVIAHGALDFFFLTNGTLLAIQNMTFGGRRGFQTPPTEPFYVPYHRAGPPGSLAGAGVLGTTHSERGLTYVAVALAGHMVPQYAPSAAFRHVEYLLGRVGSLSSKAPFTTDPGIPQPDGPLGKGTGPPVALIRRGWGVESSSVAEAEAHGGKGGI
ncbi:uncharacterized protein UV8b_04664 [Ustilaginoidea virens]|uniref:Carboxypeptidase n=1 Tax=Ustilaginoidea virens TaxID=1159556 RepID=A0A8E5HS87_USTVR|nr:uncharacterized protein UV8b_04664 [Ustilaginoidea virens]QUC20423.1 hypothetical protein UV8b_04664 [Ustilaginoidea virens]